MAFWNKLFGKSSAPEEPAPAPAAAPLPPPPPPEPPKPSTVLVQEMGELLRGLTQEKRTLHSVLLNLARAAQHSLAERLEPMDPHELVLDDASWAHIRELAGKLRFQANTVAAFALLARASRQELTEWKVEAEDVEMVGAAFRGSADSEFGKIVSGLRTKRTALDVLEDLARDSGNKRVGEFARKLREVHPSGLFRVNDEQQALTGLLTDRGKPMNPHTMMALCLFVDTDAGLLGTHLLPALVEHADTVDSSLYAMVAAGQAFGLPLVALALEESLPSDSASFLAELTRAAGGSLAACYRRPGRTGRWWERLATPEDAARVELEYSLEFAGLVMLSPIAKEGELVLRRSDWTLGPGEGLPVGDPSVFPGRLRELDSSTLVRFDPAESERFLLRARLLRALHEANRPIQRVSLRANPELIHTLVRFLRTDRAAALLEGLVHPDTLDGLLSVLEEDRSLDFQFYEPLAGALRTADRMDWLALPVVLRLCEDDTLKLRGKLKQFDGKRLATLMRQRLSDQLFSEEPEVRLTAARLLATRDGAGEGQARVLAEDMLASVLMDDDKVLVSAATEGLVRLVLLEQLPGLVDVSASTLQATQEDNLDRDEVARNLDEIRQWVALLAENDELEPLKLPFTDQDGRVLDEQATPLAEVLAAARQASRNDKSHLDHLYLMVEPESAVRELGLELVEGFRKLAKAEKKSLYALMREGAERVLLYHRNWLEESSKPPVLGGWRGTSTVYHQSPGREIGVFIEPGKASPLFLELVERLRRGVSIRLLRLVEEGNKPPRGMDVIEHSYRTDRAFEPRQLHLLQVRSARWVPLVMELYSFLPADLPNEDRPRLAAILDLYHHKRAGTLWDNALAAGAEETAPPPADRDSLDSRLARLAPRFGLPENALAGVELPGF